MLAQTMIPTPSDRAPTTSGGAGGRMVTADGHTVLDLHGIR